MNILKRTVCLLLPAIAVLLASCKSMDSKYEQFVKDGPINYITKVDIEQVQAIGERGRIHFIWPAQDDLRGTKAVITWANKLYSHEEALDPAQQTSFRIENLDEGSYIFEITLFDVNGNFSLPVTVTGSVYGATWESYQPNRSLVGNSMSEGDRHVSFNEWVKTENNPILVRTEFEWQEAASDKRTLSISAAETAGVMQNFAASSFRYRTVYIPEEGGADEFFSPWQYFTNNVTAAVVEAGFDKPTNKYLLPVLDDAHWTGYEFLWTDIVSNEVRIQRTASPNMNEITLQNYKSTQVAIRTLFKYDDTEMSSTELVFATVRFVDLDRSGWFAPYEKMADGTEVKRVIDFGSQANSTAGQKSAYLSHKLPFSASAITTANGDGANNPRAHFDGNKNTYLSLVKGFGSTWQTNREGSNGGVNKTHSNGGVSSDGNDIWFVIDLGAEVQFNYYRMLYRSSNASNYLKPQAISVYGSNDASAVTDQTKWTIVQEGLVLPGASNNSGSTNHNSSTEDDLTGGGVTNMITNNVTLPEVSYRYVKVRFDGWMNTSGNTMQFAEFWLGYYY